MHYKKRKKVMEKLHELEIPERWVFGLDDDRNITITNFTFGFMVIVKIHNKLEELPFLCVGKVRAGHRRQTQITIF